MVVLHEWLSPTRTAGLAAYTISSLACVVRWANCRRNRVPSRPFGALAAVQLGLLLDIAFDWRWRVHDFWMREAMVSGVYDRRRLPQMLALGLLALGAALGSAAILYRCRRRVGVALAMTGTLLSVGLWCSEWISFHWVDQVYYYLVGKLMLVSLLWLGLAALTCFGVWLDARVLRRSIPPADF
jgi:hypothetical protein